MATVSPAPSRPRETTRHGFTPSVFLLLHV